MAEDFPNVKARNGIIGTRFIPLARGKTAVIHSPLISLTVPSPEITGSDCHEQFRRIRLPEKMNESQLEITARQLSS